MQESCCLQLVSQQRRHLEHRALMQVRPPGVDDLVDQRVHQLHARQARVDTDCLGRVVAVAADLAQLGPADLPPLPVDVDGSALRPFHKTSLPGPAFQQMPLSPAFSAGLPRIWRGWRADADLVADPVERLLAATAAAIFDANSVGDGLGAILGDADGR